MIIQQNQIIEDSLDDIFRNAVSNHTEYEISDNNRREKKKASMKLMQICINYIDNNITDITCLHAVSRFGPKIIGRAVYNKVASSLFKAYPSTSSFSRSAINQESGATTGMAALISVGMVVVPYSF